MKKWRRGKKKTQLSNSCNRFSISMGNTEAACGSQKNSKNVLRLGKQVYSEVLKNSVYFSQEKDLDDFTVVS